MVPRISSLDKRVLDHFNPYPELNVISCAETPNKIIEYEKIWLDFRDVKCMKAKTDEKARSVTYNMAYFCILP